MSNVATGKSACSGWNEVDCFGGMFAMASGDDGWTAENSLLSDVGEAQAVDTYQLKTALAPLDGGYEVQLLNRGGGSLALDQATLAAMDHAGGVEVWLSGDHVVTGTAQSVHRIETTAEEDVTDRFGDPDNPATLVAGDTLVVYFTDGDSLVDALLLETATPARSTIRDSSGVLVQIPASGGAWTTVARHHPRRHFDAFVVDSLSSAKARLVFLSGASVRAIGKVIRGGSVQVQPLSLLWATHSRLDSVTTTVASADRAATTLNAGDLLTLRYEAPSLESGKVRDWLLGVRGSLSAPRGGELARGGQVQPAEPLPIAFALGQNHPNPFSAATTIRFEVPRPAWVRVEIFDVQGRHVRQLVDRLFEPGRWSVDWDRRLGDGAAAAPGVYLYRFQTAGFQDQKKMVLLP